MALRGGEVFNVLDEVGEPIDKAHPILVILVNGDLAVISNFTDVNKETDLACICSPFDDPAIFTKVSAFRYRSIKEKPAAPIERALIAGTVRNRGILSTVAFDKVKAGIFTSDGIRDHYRSLIAVHYGLTPPAP